MFSESDLLPLSGLQHLAYCERQWALIHIERAWAENRWTVEGRILHERVDIQGIRTRGEVRIARGLPIRSIRLGLIGRADVVEFHRLATRDDGDGAIDAALPINSIQDPLPAQFSDLAESAPRPVGISFSRVRGFWRPFPVEYKRGKPKPGDCDRVQLCAQALCLEEILNVSIASGALFYGKDRRRENVEFSPALRERTEALAERMHAMMAAGTTPRMAYESRRCDRCSLVDLCLPKAIGTRGEVGRYMEACCKFKYEDPACGA